MKIWWCCAASPRPTVWRASGQAMASCRPSSPYPWTTSPTPTSAPAPPGRWPQAALEDEGFLDHTRQVTAQLKAPFLTEQWDTLTLSYTRPETPIFLLTHPDPAVDLKACFDPFHIKVVSAAPSWGWARTRSGCGCPCPRTRRPCWKLSCRSTSSSVKSADLRQIPAAARAPFCVVFLFFSPVFCRTLR